MPKGGKRIGAGRKPGTRSKMHRALTDISIDVLSKVDVAAIWTRLLRCKQHKIVLDAMIYLHDRAFGRPVQMIAGDPNKPISISLQWGNTQPEWMQVVDLTECQVESTTIQALTTTTDENSRD